VDGIALLHESLDARRSILVEGAQATMLDIDYGTYPYVTSTSTTVGGACVGASFGPMSIGEVIGITKAYTTRVGAGPFPTEDCEEAGERLSRLGEEFGTTTGRKRRCGWYDALVVDYGCRLNGVTQLVIAKLDVLSGFERIKVCVAYEVDGERVESLGELGASHLDKAVPVYEEHDGWNEPIRGFTSLKQLPKATRRYLDRLEELARVPITLIGTGPERKEVVVA
jgi:adenylosuccinate synthase